MSSKCISERYGWIPDFAFLILKVFYRAYLSVFLKGFGLPTYFLTKEMENSTIFNDPIDLRGYLPTEKFHSIPGNISLITKSNTSLITIQRFNDILLFESLKVKLFSSTILRKRRKCIELKIFVLHEILFYFTIMM